MSSVHDQREPRNPELSSRDASRPANLLTTRCLPEPGTLDPGTLDPRCPHEPEGTPEPGCLDPEISTRDASGTRNSRFRHLPIVPFMSAGAQTLCHRLGFGLWANSTCVWRFRFFYSRPGGDISLW